MFGSFGPWEIILVLLVLLLVFGAKRLPELGGSLGKGIREFKRSIREIEGELTRPGEDAARELKAPPRQTPAVPPAASESKTEATD